MSGWLRVDPEDLHVSASTVDMHADDMRTKHGAADGRIESAQAGLPTDVVAALNGKVAQWQASTSAIYGRMAGHSEGLRTGATAYLQKDETSATGIAEAGNQIPDMGL